MKHKFQIIRRFTSKYESLTLMLKRYLNNLQATINQGDAREESYYKHLEGLILEFADANKLKKVNITVLPKKTEAGNPDFRVWDGRNHITG